MGIARILPALAVLAVASLGSAQTFELRSIISIPNIVTGGFSTIGQIDHRAGAPTGTLIHLRSNNPAVSVPESVAANTGGGTTRFLIRTTPVARNTTATITATVGSVSVTTPISVTLARIENFTMTPLAVTGGQSFTGTVLLDGPAATGGRRVILEKTSPLVTAPAFVTVPAGRTSFTFAMSSRAVSARTEVSITAVTDQDRLEESVLLRPLELDGLTIAPRSVIGGANLTGTVWLNGPARVGGYRVTLTDNAAAVGTPASVLVPAGQSRLVFTIPTNLVSASTPATVTALVPGLSLNSSVTLGPNRIVTARFPGASHRGGTPVNLTITMAGVAPAAGIPIALSSSSPLITVPSTPVRVLSGRNSLVVPLTTRRPTVNTRVTVTARFGTQSVPVVIFINR